jgi:hypothetical protein
MAWVCAWKAHHYFNLEQFSRCAFYVLLVVLLLIIVGMECLHVNP